MLNITILHLLISHSLKSPFLTPSCLVKVSKSSFSCFSHNFLYTNNPSIITHSAFTNFLSTAIKFSNFDRVLSYQTINQSIESRDDRLQIYYCLFRNCISSGGGGGAIFKTGGSIEVNYTGFHNCYVNTDRTYGGAIYADANLVTFNGVCADSCHTLDYGQSFYLINKDSKLEFITISRCGSNTASFSSEALSVLGTVDIQNLNSTANSVKGKAAGCWCAKVTQPSEFRVTHSSFVSNTGISIFDISSDVDDLVSFSNFISNTAQYTIFSYGPSTRPMFSQCVFKTTSSDRLVFGISDDNIVSLSNCYSSTDNWGNATLDNCAVAETATVNNPFYSQGICDGNFNAPTQPPPTPTSNSQSGGQSSNTIIPPTTVITSLYPLPSATPVNGSIVCPECVSKKDVGKIVAIVFCILEALLIIILIVFIILLIIYQQNKNKSQNQPNNETREKENEPEDPQMSTIEEEAGEDTNNQKRKGIDFIPTPHAPSADSSPSGQRRKYHANQITPQIPRKKRKRQVPLNEQSPLIEEKQRPKIIFSSSESETE